MHAVMQAVTHLRAVWPLVLVLAVGACQSVENWHDVRTQRQPEVRSVDHHHTVEFSGRSTRLSEREAQRLYQFLAAHGAETTNHVAVSPRLDAGADGRRIRDATARANAVSRALRERGFDPTVVATPAVAEGGGTRVDVLVRQYFVAVAGCPDWSDWPGWNFGNQTSSNWSCATAANLGVMVADPGDLISGSPARTGLADPLARSIDRYRRDEIKELKIETTTTAFPQAAGQQ